MTGKLLHRVKAAAVIAVAAMSVSLLQVPVSAYADTAPPDPTDPKTPVSVAADPLPTVQIDGVAWAQLVVGNTVYVGGSFTTARPAGSAPGTNTTARANLLAYDIRTGELISSWAPTTNSDVRTLVASPDKTRIYVGGSFTQVNGGNYARIAALDAKTGAVIPTFHPRPDATVRAIVATSDTVYFGGLLSQVDGVTRTRAAAVRASDAALLSWSPVLTGGSVHSMVMSPDGSKIVIGGSFTAANGSSNPGYGLVMVTPDTATSLPLPANNKVRNGGDSSAILSLTTDADSFYASGFVFGAGGNLEGVSRIRWADGGLEWVEDCHGDSYGTFPKGDLIYVSSHSHYCGNLPDGFPQTDPWTMHYGTAFTKATTGVLTADPLGYANWAGTPSPSLQKWLPKLVNGTYTGQGQAGWNVVGNADYVAIGGEFPTAGGIAQQGLVRYAVKSIAPNKVGPEVTGAKFNPNVTSFARGTARISWQANWDRDNELLRYEVIRDGVMINESTQLSSEWTRPAMGFLDTGLVPGSTHKYRVFAIDPFGNYARSDYVSVVVSEDGDISTYAQGVLDDKATNYWRLGEPSGDTVYDWAGYGDATVRSGVTRGADGAIIGDTNKAASFSANDNGLVSQSITQKGPDTFTTEAWIKTTTRKGGKIIGFGSNPTGDSSSYDRHVYMGNDGRINFGVYPGGVRLVTSPLSYNDGEWHHVVSSLSTSGMQLFVDGRRVANRTDTTTGQAYMGVWRIGGDNIGGWPNSPTSKYFDGVIDDVAVYPTALTATQIRKHYVDSGRSLAGSVAPADDYGKAVYNSEPDLYWRLNEATGTAAADSSPNFQAGTYNGGYTLGSPSGVGLSTDTSVTLDGTNGAVASNNTFVNPTTYSEELWFKTATTNGGKLIGFGNAQFGSSSGYDRHVYMLNSGQLRFGVWTGQTNVIDSPSSYNDDKWHHLVASQGADGMKLYVDDQLVGTNPQTGAQDYTGYWRVGGDNQWGDANSNYFAGSIDEVAVYSKVLTTAEIQDHFLKGGGTLPNAKPVAAFSFEVSDLSVAFDGSGSSDSDGSVASYAWDFGDGGSSDVAKPSHVFAAAGDYQVKLTVTDDKGATDSVTKTVTAVAPPANVKPVAAFSFEVSDLSVAFDGSGSSDSDGSVASYAWDFGDGGSSDVAKPSHVFAAAGDYQVKLTVTDDKGATDSVTKTVTAVAPPANVKPVAAFSFEVSDLSVAFDGSESSDSDGSVASYAWDFGDGGSSDVAKPSHVFAAAGDYQVKLTVTDDKGATDSVTKTVTAVAAPVGGPLAADAFGRSVTGGWGSADTGGAWTTSGSSTYYSVSGGVGHIRSPLAARGGAVTLKSVSSTDTDVSVTVSLDKVADGGGTYVSLGGRANDAGDYRAKVKVLSTGRVVLYLVKVVGSTETTLKSLNLPSSLTYVAGSPLQVRLQVAGTSPTTVQAKVWQGTEPSAWQLSTTDSTSGLQDPGGIALVTYVSGTTTNTPIDITFDNLSANAQDAPPPANVKPVAAFSFVVSDLSVAFDGSGSSDSDGSVASYAWDFGDGGSSDVAKPSHVFAAAGDYQVKLTVTDDKGATDSVTKTVTAVAAPVGGPLAADAFGRSVTGGWGSADTGGAWTTSGSSTYYSVSGGVGHIRSPLAARGGAVTLKSVSSTDTDVSVTVSLDKVADGGGTYVSLGGRANDAGDYRAKVKVLSTGRVVLYLVKVVGSTETTLKSLNLPSSLTYVAGSPLQVRLQVAGTSPTTVQAKVWQGTEPSAWQLSTTDSTSGLQDPGGIALVTYVSGTTTNTPIDITFDDLLAKGSQN